MRTTYLLPAITVLSLNICMLSGQEVLNLEFPSGDFSEQVKTVATASGDVTIVLKVYRNIPYVAKPVDRDYQSLNVYVPVRIKDRSVDHSEAPILFDIAVGGYMSVSTARLEKTSRRADLALAAGIVVVAPACRGRDNRTPDGRYFGKAPAALVDLKAAVRYIRHNTGKIPGNTDCIVSAGCSAGGALSAVLGTSGNSPLFKSYLEEIGAADARDDIFASACYSPITDLEHADMAYEWMFGKIPGRSGLADQQLSEQLAEAFIGYQLSLGLEGKEGFGILTAENYHDYLLRYYLYPSFEAWIKSLPPAEFDKYLAGNTWIRLTDGSVSFSFNDYVKHIGRMKGLPAFDDFEKRQPEPSLFGNDSVNARHFTLFALSESTGDRDAAIDQSLETVINMMNALYFTEPGRSDCAPHWWLRNGTADNHTSQTVMINLATRLQNTGRDVNAWLFWDGGHCADDDPEGLISWISKISGN